MDFNELVNIIKNKEQSSKQQSKNKQRTKVLKKRIKHG